MPYVTLNITHKIDGLNGFDNEADAHKFAQKHSYPILLIFEGVAEDLLYGRLKRPIAIYVKGKRFDVQPVEE